MTMEAHKLLKEDDIIKAVLPPLTRAVMMNIGRPFGLSGSQKVGFHSPDSAVPTALTTLGSLLYVKRKSGNTKDPHQSKPSASRCGAPMGPPHVVEAGPGKKVHQQLRLRGMHDHYTDLSIKIENMRTVGTVRVSTCMQDTGKVTLL